MMVIERLGKYHGIAEGGYFWSIPLVDEIRFVIDMREKAIAIAPQACITKDNVHVTVSGNLFLQFMDAWKAAYGSKNPMYSVRQHAQSAMRAAIGELELDEILHARVKLNDHIKMAVAAAAEQWGLDIKRYEITEISPDKHITEVMDEPLEGGTRLLK
jgi:regulator of protease activity HflC (stomatin/prohibitin superfamily)